MRLTLVGKIVIFALGLAGLYALWQRVRPLPPPRALPAVRLKRSAPTAENAAPEQPRETDGLVLGYAGTPPPAAVNLERSTVQPTEALEEAAGEDVTLTESPDSRTLMEGLRTGALDAAVVDFPTVVFAARGNDPPFVVLLLVSWRVGADVLKVRGGGAWKPGRPTYFARGASGEYLLRRVLGSGVYSPIDLAEGRKRLERPPARDAAWDAAAGRIDQLPEAARAWPVWRSTEQVPAPMPDVLVARPEWVRQRPEQAAGLVRAWLRGQDAVQREPRQWERFAARYARPLGLSAEEMAAQVRPADVLEQTAFVGLGGKGARYTTLVMQQMVTMEGHGARPPGNEFRVPVDPEPLRAALANRDGEGGRSRRD